MPLDPVRVAETREWLEKAALDLRGARIDIEAAPPLLEDALFHCQQAVEAVVSCLPPEAVPPALLGQIR